MDDDEEEEEKKIAQIFVKIYYIVVRVIPQDILVHRNFGKKPYGVYRHLKSDFFSEKKLVNVI